MWYWIVRSSLIAIFKVVFRFKVEGLEHIPKKTNFIVVANHSSFLDPFILGAAIPERIYWIAWSAFHNLFWSKWFMKISGAIPTGSASDKAISLLAANKSIGLFPEGTRSHDGSIREFRRGAALFALKTGRPILPCAIIGAYKALPRSAFFPKFVPITVKIGKPKYLLKEFGNFIDDIYLQEGIFVARNTIKELINAK